MFDNKKQDVSPNIDPKALLDEMENRGLIVYSEDGEGKFYTTEVSRWGLTMTEIAVIILPYCLDVPNVSTRELERLTGIDRRRISECRQTAGFATLLLEHSNRIMSRARTSALVELEKIVNNPKSSDNSKIKASDIILRHTADILEIYQKNNKEEEKTVDIDDLMKLLDNMPPLPPRKEEEKITQEQLEQYMKEIGHM